MPKSTKTENVKTRLYFILPIIVLSSLVLSLIYYHGYRNFICMVSVGCWADGLCKSEDGRCTTGCNAPCRISGHCTLVDGFCIAEDRSDCLNSEACETYGRCSAKNRTCVALLDEDCKVSVKCRREGKCSAKNNICLPSSHADCAQSSGCALEGKCWYNSLSDKCVKCLICSFISVP